MQCEVVSYERSQILFSWAIRIRLEEVVNGRLQPDWFSCTSDSMITHRWRRFTSADATCQLTCVTIIEVCGHNISAHNRRPGAGREIAIVTRA
jgi:hypothetical protein